MGYGDRAKVVGLAADGPMSLLEDIVAVMSGIDNAGTPEVGESAGCNVDVVVSSCAGPVPSPLR